MKYPWILRIISLLLIGAGFLLHYISFRKDLQRRSVKGFQVFKSFARAWLTRFVERSGSLIGKLLIVAGIIGWVLTMVR